MLPVLRRTIEPRPASHRRRCIGTQRLGQRGQVVAPVAPLPKDSPRDQRPQKPRECVRIRLDTASQLIDGQRTVRQRVRDPELGCSVNRLRYPRAHDQLRQRHRRRNEPLMEAIQMVADPLDTPSKLRRRSLGVGGHTLLPTRSAARDPTTSLRK